MKFYKPILFTFLLILLEAVTFQVFLHYYDSDLTNLEGTEEFFTYAFNGDIITVSVSYLITLFILYRKDLQNPIDYEKPKTNLIFLSIVLGFALFLVSGTLYKSDNYLFNSSYSSELSELQFYPLVWLSIIVFPFFQELIFRRFILTNLVKNYSNFIAISVSVICFSTYHYFSFDSPISIIPLSITTALLYLSTQNISYPIIVNFSFSLLRELSDTFDVEVLNFFPVNIQPWVIWPLEFIAIGLIYVVLNKVKQLT